MTLDITSLQAKILCTTHNNELSNLDAEAIQLYKTVSGIERVLSIRWRRRENHMKVFEPEIDGLLLERWSAKTVVGVFCAGFKNRVWREGKSTILEPPHAAVQAIYGRAKFCEPMGLYFTQHLPESKMFREEVQIELLTDGDEAIVGGILRLRGFSFLVWLTLEYPNNLDIFDSERKQFELTPQSKYRPFSYEFRVGRCLSHKLTLGWK